MFGLGVWVLDFAYWVLGGGFWGPLRAWKCAEDFWRPAPGGGLRFSGQPGSLCRPCSPQNAGIGPEGSGGCFKGPGGTFF